MIHHFTHLFEGLAITLLVLGILITAIPGMIWHRHVIRKIRREMRP